MTFLKKFSVLYKRFTSKKGWQPHDEFMVEFERDHKPYWSDEHGQRHYSPPQDSREREEVRVFASRPSLPLESTIFVDGLQPEDTRRYWQ